MLRSALIGAAITLACIVVPVVHFITAIPSAFIGGYVAGARLACAPGQALAVAGLMAALLAVPVLAAAVIVRIVDPEFPIGFVAGAGVTLLVWFGGSGAVGAALGGVSARRKASQ